MGVSRSALAYRSARASKDAPALARMAELSAQYPRYGYRRIAIFLARDGYPMSFGGAHRPIGGHRLQVPEKRSRKRIIGPASRPYDPAGAQRSVELRLRLRLVRQRPEIEMPDRDRVNGRRKAWRSRWMAASASAGVIAVLSRLVSERGAPLYLRSDNGPEFVSRALLTWIVDQGIATALIDPGKPWQNGTGESFNGKFRDECLSLEWFRSRAEAKVVIETWRRHYNEVRPHSRLGYLTPAAFAAQLRRPDATVCQATGQTAAVYGAYALRPVAPPSRKGQTKAETGAVVSS